MNESSNEGQAPVQTKRRRIRIGTILFGVVVIAVVGAVSWYLLDDADFFGNDDPVDTGSGGAVSIPQVPSVKMLLEEGTLYVENDGNVTMSDVEVRDAVGTVICALGVISPGDRRACEEAGGATDLTAFGSGPQGQPVQADLLTPPDSG